MSLTLFAHGVNWAKARVRVLASALVALLVLAAFFRSLHFAGDFGTLSHGVKNLIPWENTESPSSDADRFNAYNFAGSREQCGNWFDDGLLFSEIDRSFNYWKSRGGISRRMVEHAADSVEWDAAVHLAIVNNQIFVKRFHHAWQTRAMSTLFQMTHRRTG
jgi:hypothetical protein